MQSGVSNTTPSNIINNKNTWKARKGNSYHAIVLIVFGLLGVSYGTSGGSIPSLDDIAQFVDRMEDAVISHDVPATPVNLVNNFKVLFELNKI